MWRFTFKMNTQILFVLLVNELSESDHLLTPDVQCCSRFLTDICSGLNAGVQGTDGDLKPQKHCGNRSGSVCHGLCCSTAVSTRWGYKRTVLSMLEQC